MKLSREKLFPYSIGEDIANAVTHGIGVLFASFALIHLVYVAATNGNAKDVYAFAFYGISMVLMFLMSTLYHGIRHYSTRDVFKRLDHSMIFILILGTYTPFIFSGLKTQEAYIVYIILVVVSILGILFKAFFVSKFKIVSTILYIIMGWLSIFLMNQMVVTLDSNAVRFLIIGGSLYTVGAVVYAFFKMKYHHMIWHLFVLAGAITHYVSIGFYLLK